MDYAVQDCGGHQGSCLFVSVGMSEERGMSWYHRRRRCGHPCCTFLLVSDAGLLDERRN
jgi:hypothetical protein